MPSMAYSIDRNNLVYIARLAQKAERYDEMVESMKKVAKLEVELSGEERYLLHTGYQYVISARRASWRKLLSIEQEKNDPNVKRIKEYRQKVESELTSIANDIIAVLDEHLIPSSSTGEAMAFYFKMKGDYYRYLAAIKTGDDRKEVAEQSLKAYEIATTMAEADLHPAHPLRLGLALNFSVFYHDIMNSPQRAGLLAKNAFDEAISKLCDLNGQSYKVSYSILQRLRLNFPIFTFDIENGDANN